MLVIPALNIKNGKLVQRFKSEDGFAFMYEELQDNPTDVCKLWRSENARTLYISDLDGEPNSLSKQKILEILECMDIPIILSSSSTSLEECELFLSKGAHRVAICRFAIDNENDVKYLIQKYTPSRINFYAIVQDNYINYWGEKTDVTLENYLEKIQKLGATRLIYGDTEWMGNMEYADLNKVQKVLNLFKGNLTLFCGVPNYSGFQRLNQLNNKRLDSVILSKSLYENNFPCQKLWRMAELL